MNNGIRMVLSFIAPFLLSAVLHAQDLQNLKFQSEDFDHAAKAESYLRFDMKSTKMGLLTTSFSGYVKSFDLSYKQEADAFQNVTIRFQAQSLDTDVGARNTKMWELCFDYKTHPEIILSFPGPIRMSDNQALGTIRVRGVEKPIQISFRTVRENNIVQSIEGTAMLSLKGLELPDPSILVAKVKDEIQVSFRIVKPGQ